MRLSVHLLVAQPMLPGLTASERRVQDTDGSRESRKQPHGKSRGLLGVQPAGPRLPAHALGTLETTLTEKLKTDVRVLPQLGPLEGQAVGPQDSAGSPRNGPVPNAARQQGRGETGQASGPRYQLRKEIL
jgi:hypothetical protein